MQWTKEHDAFCLENRLPPAAKLLWQWLSRAAKLVGDEIEPDLNDFNDWVAKHRGKPYCRPTLKDAMNRLIDARVIAPLRQFTWRIYRLVVRPLEWLHPTGLTQLSHAIAAIRSDQRQGYVGAFELLN